MFRVWDSGIQALSPKQMAYISLTAIALGFNLCASWRTVYMISAWESITPSWFVIFLCIYMHACTYVFMRPFIYVSVYMHILHDILFSVAMITTSSTTTGIIMYTDMYIYIYIHTCTYIYIYIYIHTFCMIITVCSDENSPEYY